MSCFSSLIARVRQEIAPAVGPPDEELLEAFIADRDPNAFADLVRRHGPMVIGVCRRITGHAHDAEDAFQATFLVLARRAGVVDPRAAVGNWLYGVAVRTAREVRVTAARRRSRERPTEMLPEVGRPDPDPSDLRSVVDEEMIHLPGKYRTVLVLCDLEGESQVEVARRLGVPVGTIYSRLAAARSRLAGRLRKRGLAALAVPTLVGPAAARLAPGLLKQTARFGATPGTAPPAILSLPTGGFTAMIAKKFHLVIVLAGLVAGIAISWLGAAGPTPRAFSVRADPPRTHPPTGSGPSIPVALPKGSNRLLFDRAGVFAWIDPDGRTERTIETGRERPIGLYALSPDGTRVATLSVVTPTPPGRDPTRNQLFVRQLDEKTPGTDLGVDCELVLWSPDGTLLLCQGFPDGSADRQVSKLPEEIFLVDTGTKKKTQLKLPPDHIVTDWTRDARSFLTTRIDADAEKPNGRIYLIDRDGTGPRPVTDGTRVACFGKLSPDGTRVLCYEVDVANPKEKWRWTLATVNVATGVVAPVGDVPLNSLVQGFCWSPDGKRIAYTWRQVHEGDGPEVLEQETESHLIACDPDGKNQKTLASEKAPTGRGPTIAHVDWR